MPRRVMSRMTGWGRGRLGMMQVASRRFELLRTRPRRPDDACPMTDKRSWIIIHEWPQRKTVLGELSADNLTLRTTSVPPFTATLASGRASSTSAQPVHGGDDNAHRHAVVQRVFYLNAAFVFFVTVVTSMTCVVATIPMI